MKSIIILVLFICSLAQAQNNSLTHPVSGINLDQALCEQEMQQTFEKYRQIAITVWYPEHKARLEQFQPKFINSRPGSDGSMELDSNIIILDPKKLCKRTELERSVIVAHEIGHVIAQAIYPELESDMRSSVHRISDEVQEAEANKVAAVIFPRDRFDDAMELMKGYCARGMTYQCNRAIAWRQGIGRYE